MNRVLLVEDAVSSQILVSRALENSVDLRVAGDIASANRLMASEEFQLLLLDLDLPDGSGLSFCSQLAAENSEKKRPRIIFLTGSHNMADKLAGFSVGGDDYVTKPWNPLELKARVLSQLRSLEDAKQSTKKLRVGNLAIDLGAHSVHLESPSGNREIRLTPTEFKLLYALAENESRIVPRERLLELIVHHEDANDRSIDSHLSNLRKKLGHFSHAIEGVYGVGYRLISTNSGTKE